MASNKWARDLSSESYCVIPDCLRRTGSLLENRYLNDTFGSTLIQIVTLFEKALVISRKKIVTPFNFLIFAFLSFSIETLDPSRSFLETSILLVDLFVKLPFLSLQIASLLVFVTRGLRKLTSSFPLLRKAYCRGEVGGEKIEAASTVRVGGESGSSPSPKLLCFLEIIHGTLARWEDGRQSGCPGRS